MTRSLTFVIATAFAILWCIGCDTEPPTPGERLDNAIDGVQEAGEELKNQAKEAADEIGDEMKSNEDKTIGEKIDEDGLDINIGGDKAAPEAGAIDVEVGGGKGVQVDVERKQEPE